MKKIYFLSGLPRSGSTVLAALLQQHPEMHTTATSGLLDMLVGTLKAWADSLSQKLKHPRQSSAGKRNTARSTQAICETKYADIDKPVILDKARGLGV
jgi:sulfotransferase